ncbi:MAG TPA: ABC transporter permease [Phycisphaerae bacterium]|nr:ABC transporter permease [Phycisphaerae bacterium]
MIATVAKLGAIVSMLLAEFGDFCTFCGHTMRWSFAVLFEKRYRAELLEQFYFVGTRSVVVVMVTGLFVGAVLAVQTVPQFKAAGMVEQMGSVVNLSVLRELGPVLAGVMLAGRVGGGLTAELGTMRVTQQIDALRAMGMDPLAVLVTPRFLACLLLIPVLAFYASFMGILGGYFISIGLYGVDGGAFWELASRMVGVYDIFYGPIKCLFFGAAMSLICCYKGFNCKPGAAGVGRACTESFVVSCMALLAIDLLLGMTLNTIIELVWGIKSMLA